MAGKCWVLGSWRVAVIVPGLVLALPAQDRVLHVDEAVRGRVTAKSAKHEVEIDGTKGALPGEAHLVEVAEGGAFAIEAKSYFFDTLVVVRDPDGKVVAVDDDGGLRTHSRAVCSLEAGKRYVVVVCALEGYFGDYEVALREKKPGESAVGKEPEDLDSHLEVEDLRRELNERRTLFEESDDACRQSQVALATALNRLGVVLDESGHAGDALPLFQESLSMRQRAFPGDHPDVARSLNIVACCLESLGRAGEALPLYQESLAMKRRVFPGDHPDVAVSLNNVASCLNSLGRAGEALPLYQELLSMMQRVFPGDHANVANGLNNVASCLLSLGRAGEALPVHQQSLAMRRRAFRGDHPDVAVGLNSVASCLLSLGRAGEALLLFQESLSMMQRVFPRDHAKVASGLNNVASCLESLGRAGEALPVHQQSLAMRRRLFPGDHPNVAGSLNNVASCLDSLGRAGDALPLYQESLSMRQRAFPGDHPDVALGLNNVASCLVSLGRAGEALPLYQESLSMRRRVFPGDHPDVASSLVNLAWLSSVNGGPTEAIRFLEQATTMIERLRFAARTLDRDTQQSYFAELKRGDPYELMRHLQVAADNPREALRYVERSRGRAMLDILEENRFDPLARSLEQARSQDKLDLEQRIESLRHRLDESHAEVARLEHAVAVLASDRSISPEDREARQQALREEMRTAYEKRRRAVQEERGVVADLDLLPSGPPADPDQMQALVGQGELLLSFALDDVQSHVFVVPPAPAPIEVIALPMQRAAVEVQANLLLRALSHGQVFVDDERSQDRRGLDPEAVAPTDWQSPSAALAKGLLPGDLWQRLRGCRRVWLLPDGPLHRTPFETLIVGEAKGKPIPWLQDGPPISYAPSGGALLKVRERARVQRKQSPRLDLLALGDPVFQHAAADPVPEQGALLVRVDKGGEAQRAGLRPLDVVVRYDGVAIADSAALKQALRAVEDHIEAGSRSADAAIQVAVWRHGSPTQVDLEVRAGRELGVVVGRGAARAAYAAATVARDAQLERFGELRPLPGTHAEVEAAMAAFASERAKTLLAGDATEAAVFEQAPMATYVHLATHGLSHAYAGQNFSALALSLPAISTDLDNGFLTLEDLMTRWGDRLGGCRMVVMSACRTAIGPLLRDEAVHALPLGFFYAGASSVVGSLWNVNDASTAALMSDFYRRLAAAEKAGAVVDRLQLLHEAKRTLARTYPDPFHWAPFLYFGSPE